jgi:hypothetical protein
MSSRVNLLFSLPDDLITEIYGTFDPTYRIFHTPEFHKELAGAGWLNHHKKMIQSRIRDHTLDMIDDLDFCFKNEYGFMGEIELTSEEFKKYTRTEELTKFKRYDKKAINYDGRIIQYNEDTFQIYLHPAKGEYMFFKILPLGATKKNCAFLRNPQRFDGFVCHKVTGNEDWNLDAYNRLAVPHLINDDALPTSEWRDGICLFQCSPIEV